MPIRFACPHCAKTLKVEEKYAGKRSKCPQCQVAVQVPASNEKPVHANPYDALLKFQDEQEQSCPHCQKSLPREAVLCVGCGYNFKTRQVMPAASTAPEMPAVNPFATQQEPAAATVNRDKLMKLGIGAAVAAVLGLGLWAALGTHGGKTGDVERIHFDTTHSTSSTASDSGDATKSNGSGTGEELVSSPLTPVKPVKPDGGKKPTTTKPDGGTKPGTGKPPPDPEVEKLTAFKKDVGQQWTAYFQESKDEYAGLAMRVLQEGKAQDATAIAGSAMYLSLFDTAENFELIKSAYLNDKLKNQRASLLKALGNFTLPEAVEFVLQCWRDSVSKEPQVAAEALRAYSRHGGKAGLDELLSRYSDLLRCISNESELLQLLRRIDFERTQKVLIAEMIDTGDLDEKRFNALYAAGDSLAIGAIVELLADTGSVDSGRRLNDMLTKITYIDPFRVFDMPPQERKPRFKELQDYRSSWFRTSKSRGMDSWAEKAAEELAKGYRMHRLTAETQGDRLKKMQQRSQQDWEEIGAVQRLIDAANGEMLFYMRQLTEYRHPAFAKELLDLAELCPVDDRDGKKFMSSLSLYSGKKFVGYEYREELKLWKKWHTSIRGKTYIEQMMAVLQDEEASPSAKKSAEEYLSKVTFHKVDGIYATLWPGKTSADKYAGIFAAQVKTETVDDWLRAAIEADFRFLERENEAASAVPDSQRVPMRNEVRTHLELLTREYFDFVAEHPASRREAALREWREWWEGKKKKFSWN